MQSYKYNDKILKQYANNFFLYKIGYLQRKIRVKGIRFFKNQI